MWATESMAISVTKGPSLEAFKMLLQTWRKGIGKPPSRGGDPSLSGTLGSCSAGPGSSLELHQSYFMSTIVHGWILPPGVSFLSWKGPRRVIPRVDCKPKPSSGSLKKATQRQSRCQPSTGHVLGLHTCVSRGLRHREYLSNSTHGGSPDFQGPS